MILMCQAMKLSVVKGRKACVTSNNINMTISCPSERSFETLSSAGPGFSLVDSNPRNVEQLLQGMSLSFKNQKYLAKFFK